VSAQDQIARLQSLLERVQVNAQKPRARAVAAAAPVAVAPAPAPEPEPEPEPELEPEPIAIAVPAPEAPHEQITGVRAIEQVEAAPEMVAEEVSLEVEELDLDEEEIVDITDVGADEIGAVEIAPDEEEEEEPPVSSRRAIAGSVGEALAGAAETVELDEGREIPLKTPPPESGPQVAPPPAMPSPPLPEIQTAEEVEVVSGPRPTAAQLGATVELEEGEEAEIEMGEPIAEAPPVHLIREETPAPAAPLTSEVIARPAPPTAAPAHAMAHAAAQAFQPKSFLELLDASISLGND